MAKIQETLVLRDQFSSPFGAYILAAQSAARATTKAQTEARNYQSVLNGVSRQMISANAKIEANAAQQKEMSAAGQQNTKAFKKLDAQTEKLRATIRGLETQQQSLTQSMKEAENAAIEAAEKKDRLTAAIKRMQEQENAAKNEAAEAAAATKRLQEQENMAQSATNSLTSSVLRLAASYVSIQGLKKAVDLSDSLVSMRARLDRMNDGLQTTQELETMIYQSAQRSRGSFTDTMGLVSQLGTMAGDAFSSSKEIVQFAEQLNKQLALSGASGSSAQAAILQLEQGLASGVLRGDELNSVMEQAPALAKSIADYMQVSVGELREMGSQGQITADIVKNALFAAAKDTNAEFEKTPMTWAQVWTVASNTAVRALDPLLAAINWVANNIQTIGPIVVSLGAAFGVLLIAANWTNILATATKTAASMQAFYNAVMAANPIALTAAAVLVLVAALYGGVAAFNKLTGSSISATGIITGSFTTMGAFILNGTLVPLHNGFAAFVNFLGNAFNDPITAIDVLFYDMSITILKYVQNVAQGLEGLINMIPGVEVNMTSGIDKLIGKLEYGRNWTIKQNGYKEYIKPWENFDLGKAYNAGHDWGANLNLSTVMGGGSGSLEIPQAADVKDLLGNIDKNTGKIAKTVDLSDEQIKMLVDVAERKYVNNVNLTSQTPMITVQGQNTGNTEKDARNLADNLRDLLLDMMNAGSTVTVQ
jgi:tape measure domain-containing protein